MYTPSRHHSWALLALAACNTTPTGQGAPTASSDAGASTSSSTGDLEVTSTSSGDPGTGPASSTGGGDGADGSSSGDSTGAPPPTECAPALGWVVASRGFPNMGWESTADLAMSPQGVLTALFNSGGCDNGTLDFGGGPQPLDLNPDGDLAVVQYDSALGHRVTHIFGGLGRTYAGGLAIDGAGSIYMVGYFNDHIDVPDVLGGASSWSAVPPELDSFASFIAVFDASGQRKFVRDLRSNGGHAFLNEVAVATDGTFYVVGDYSGTLEAAGCPTVVGDDRGFMIQAYPALDGRADPQPRWTRCSTALGDKKSGATRLSGVVATANGVVATGNFGGAQALGDPADVETHVEAIGESQDVLVAAWDAAGEHRWHRVCGSTLEDQGFGVMIDPDGGVVISGSIGDQGRCSSSGPPAESTRVRGFVATFDPDAAPDEWRFDRVLAASDGEEEIQSHFYRVIAAPCGDIYAVGYAIGFAAWEDEVNMPFKGEGASDQEDILVTRLTRDGQSVWGRRFQSGGIDAARAAATDVQGSLFVGASYGGEISGVGPQPWPPPMSCHSPPNNTDASLLHMSP